MSGVEVAGLTLGAVPLIVSAIEHYDDIVEPIMRYRRFSSQVRELHDSLHLERTMFRAECVLLLSNHVGRSQAEAMLKDVSHASWRDDTLIRSWDQSFGSLGAPCKLIVGKIVERLSKIAQKIKEFDQVGDSMNPDEYNTERSWRSTIRKKLKFALASDASLNKELKSLKKLNETFITLSSQIRQLEKTWSPDSEQQKGFGSKSALCSAQSIRKASIDLYATVSRMHCSKHQHSLKFRLFGHTVSGEETQDSSVPFNIHYCSEKLVGCTDHHGLQIDHPKTYITKTTDIGLLIHSVLKSKPESSDSVVVKASEDLVPIGPKDQRTIWSAGASKNLGDKVPLRSVEPLCQRLALMGGLQAYASEFNSHVCYEDGIIAAHEIKIAKSQLLGNQSLLSELLSRKTKQGRLNDIPLHQRLAIASCVGDNVLKLYGTPWLHENLNSDKLYIDRNIDILSNSSGTIQPETIAITVGVKLLLSGYTGGTENTIRHASIGPESNDITSPTSRFGLQLRPPNNWLYHLGVLLLELAYHMSFTDLVTEARDEYSQFSIPLPSDQTCAEFQISCQLADNVGAVLGPSYADVVRKCLRCDFGIGEITSLDDIRLQQQVLDSVVVKLQKLENGYKHLHNVAIT